MLRWLRSLFCGHEWATRQDGARVYLQCVHCLAETPGIEWRVQ